MENASKALVMAGSMLIALMILGALILLFSNLSNYQNKNDSSKKTSQIAEFNDEYNPYIKDNLTLMELKSVYNKILSNNEKNPDYEIETNILKIYPEISGDFKSIDKEYKKKKSFKCTEVEYNNSEGRISKINFKDNAK